MAVTNEEQVGRALDVLRTGLAPFVEREFAASYGECVHDELRRRLGEDRVVGQKPVGEWDAAVLLRVLWDSWNDVFRKTLGHAERSLVSELREHRNRWAHQGRFSGDDAYRVLDSAGRLLASIAAPQAEEMRTMKEDLLRQRFTEQERGGGTETGNAIVSEVTGRLVPWREVVTPHQDVASGRYQQAEFAADLWQVRLGQGTDEYRDPVEFFRRTHLTVSLRSLLVGAIQRLSGKGGDPVVQLQTAFGGGKTHSMLALYHLFSGTNPDELERVGELLQTAGVKELPSPVKRVVLVGNKISAGNPSVKPDGTVVRTLWGELAWQLGGRAAFDRIRADDERATSPGDVLRELFNEHGPCLVLVDEWVAYARQLHDKSDLPAGGFETQFTFAQVLSESAKLARACMLVVSLPASDCVTSPHTQADDVEVGGLRGREALDRLRNVVGRVESSWRPATAEEGFEIVRRRLFVPMHEPARCTDRDTTCRAFADFYRAQHAEFPTECRDSSYEKRIRDAYPIHPEFFDRLYTDWSGLVQFQRTRGVLRLMAAVIHSLWEKGDRNPLILPANVAMDDPRVQFELTRYLTDNWVPVIETDVDGARSLPTRMDGEVPNLGKFAACRRVARTVYLGSAPKTAAAHRGLDERRVKLGCMMPGESPSVFGDALRRLASAATYLYEDRRRYWYSTQPTVTRLAEDRADQLSRDTDQVICEIEARVGRQVQRMGEFVAVHAMPASGQDVPDEPRARLVVLRTDHAYTKDPGNAAEIAAKAILESRGKSPRLYRNTLVFLAADKTLLQDLDEAVRYYLAWKTIVEEKVILNLDPQQVAQAETQHENANSTVNARLPETFQWLLVPVQSNPQATMRWQATRLVGEGRLAERASKRVVGDELLVTSLAGTLLRIDLDKIPLWRGDHVTVRQLAEDYARYLYLPRLKEASVLAGAIVDGVRKALWEDGSVAVADGFEEQTGTYRGLCCAQGISKPDVGGPLLVVKPEVARKQLEVVAAQRGDKKLGNASGNERSENLDTQRRQQGVLALPETPQIEAPKRFHGTVSIDPSRVGRDASEIAAEVVAHLVGLVGAKVTVTLEIEADVPDGVPDNVVRTVTENCRAVKFKSHGFERK